MSLYVFVFLTDKADLTAVVNLESLRFSVSPSTLQNGVGTYQLCAAYEELFPHFCHAQILEREQKKSKYETICYAGLVEWKRGFPVIHKLVEFPSSSRLTLVLLLFQFDCTNTLNDQILEDVKVEMEPSDSDFEVVSYIPRPSLPYNTPGTTYTLIKLPEDASSGL